MTPTEPVNCGWIDIDSFPDDGGPPTSEHCTSGKPATFCNCGFSVPVCEDHRCRCNGPAFDRSVAIACAQRRVRMARWDLGGVLLGLLRAGEERVRFDDPRVAPAMAALVSAEEALVALGVNT